MLVVALGVPLFVFVQIWQFVGSLTSLLGLHFSSYPGLNTGIALMILLVIVCLLGWTFKFKVFRVGFDWLMNKVPLASTVAKFIPKNEELEFLSRGDMKEIRFEISPGVWLLGLVTCKIERRKRKYLRIYVATCPLPLTGNLLEVDQETCRHEYTGGGADDYFAMVASFGVRSHNRPIPEADGDSRA